MFSVCFSYSILFKFNNRKVDQVIHSAMLSGCRKFCDNLFKARQRISASARHLFLWFESASLISIFKLLYIIIYNNYIIYIAMLMRTSIFEMMRWCADARCAFYNRKINIWNKSKIKSKKACKYAEFFVPLQCQMKELKTGPLRIKIARFKSRNCAH